MPLLTIFAGINGVGKSTLYNFLNINNEPELGTRICPDEILLQFNGDWTSREHQVLSGKIAIGKIDNCLENGQSFNWETTLLSPFVSERIKKAKALGYCIDINFIGVDNYELPIKRIQHRVQNGGHGIEDATVKSRFFRQFDNIEKVLPFVDTVIFYDNANTLHIVGTYYEKSLHIHDTKNKWIKQVEEKLNQNNTQKC